MIASSGRDILDPDRPHLEIVHDGEYYLVNCPYCSDTRHRLYVNHMYGKKDEGGRRLRFLAICFNENCMSKPDNRDDFLWKLEAMDDDLETAKIAKGVRVDPKKVVARLPGPCTRLDELPDRHKAREYVRGRRFDPDRLARAYGVMYCHDSIHFLARDRLVVPVTWRGKMVGWQTRYLGELDWKGPRKAELPPKYWTMPNMPRGSITPNLDNAKLFHTAVIVEGWFDVFGFGPMAMPVMGNTVSAFQKRDIATAFRGRAGVMLLDPEEAEKPTTLRAVRELREKFSGQFCAVTLPPGTDPGSLDRDFCREYVREQAAERGVAVSYERVA